MSMMTRRRRGWKHDPSNQVAIVCFTPTTTEARGMLGYAVVELEK
jgi:hypothetical protein